MLHRMFMLRNMMSNRGLVAVVLALFCVGIMGGAQTAPSQAGLAITTAALPDINAGVRYQTQLQATGGTPPYKWNVVSGDLPDGISLEPATGVISGIAKKPGDFRATVQVVDSAVPVHSINKEFSASVIASLAFEWVKPPQVQNNRIDGTVRAANGSKSDFDLTVVVVGINEIGRATALGYQRFKLKANSVGPDIPFGTTLPKGNYVVHADAVAEVADKRQIFKQQLQSAAPLKVAVGP